jgi:hypothetical protein
LGWHESFGWRKRIRDHDRALDPLLRGIVEVGDHLIEREERSEVELLRVGRGNGITGDHHRGRVCCSAHDPRLALVVRERERHERRAAIVSAIADALLGLLVELGAV